LSHEVTGTAQSTKFIAAVLAIQSSTIVCQKPRRIALLRLLNLRSVFSDRL